MLADYRQVYDPLGNSLGLSSIVAALPLVTLFVLLGVLRMRAWLASIIGLAVALIVAVAAYSMPVGDAVNSGLLGAAFGFFPIMWIVINAIWIYNLTVETGHFDVLRRSFASISDDQRIQAVIIAFCFGALMEALAGFGTPVAISSVMLIALGYWLAYSRLAEQRQALDDEWQALDNTRRLRAVFLHARLAMRAEALRAARADQFGHQHHNQEGQ